MNYSVFKNDCFWFYESQDMNATLYFCEHCIDETGWHVPIHECAKNCNKYINKEEAKRIVLSWQENNRNK